MVRSLTHFIENSLYGDPSLVSTSSASVHEDRKESLTRRKSILMSIAGLGLATFSASTGDASQESVEGQSDQVKQSVARYEITGSIRECFDAEGGEAVLGLPLSAELPTIDGGMYQTFKKGGPGNQYYVVPCYWRSCH